MIMYRIDNQPYARMYTSTRMTGDMRMSTPKSVPICIKLRLMRSDYECPRSFTPDQKQSIQ